MESRAQLFGHPIHQMLISFPVALFVTAVGLDVVFYFSEAPQWALFSFYLIGIGIVTGVLAALFGLIDWSAIPKSTRARRIGTLHGLGNLVVTALFCISWYLRRQSPLTPSHGAMLISGAGFILLCITVWLGGELVDRLGVGVDNGANVNASSSISTKVSVRTANRPTM